MSPFPPVPSWQSLHPLVVHFPIALLLLSPVFLVVSAILPVPKGRPYLVAALAILLMGNIGLYVAEATGAAAASLAERDGVVDSVLDTHVHLASETTVAFSGLLAILFGIAILPRALGCEETRLITTFMPASFLILYCVGILFMVNAAHAGGRLVHQYGVHARIYAEKSLSDNALPAQDVTQAGRP